MLHGIQNFTMSSHFAPSSSSDSGSTQSDNLLQNEVIEEHSKDTLPHSAHEYNQSTMPPRDRTRGRSVHIFDASNRNTSIGGLVPTAGVTNANLYAMIEIFVNFYGGYILRNESDVNIEKDDFPLLPGNHYVDSPRESLFKRLFSS
jgi:hypothetical protein